MFTFVNLLFLYEQSELVVLFYHSKNTCFYIVPVDNILKYGAFDTIFSNLYVQFHI